jgi:hypothetical protein
MLVAFSFSANGFPVRIPDIMRQAAIYFFGLMTLVLGLLSLYTVFGDSVSTPSANLISYTAMVFWFVFFGSRWFGGGYSLRSKAVHQTIPRLLAIHGGFLLLIFVLQTLAFFLQPNLPPSWLADRGRDPSWFVSGLMVIFLVIGMAQVYLSRRILSSSLKVENTNKPTTL